MTRKENLAIGMIAAFVFATIMAVQPAGADNSDNSADISDDDRVDQSNSAETTQGAVNTASVGNSGNNNDNTATATSTQTAGTSQSNTNTDNDVQVANADQTDNDSNCVLC